LGKTESEHIPVSVGIDNLNVSLQSKKFTSYFVWDREKRRQRQAQEYSHVLQEINGLVKPGQLLAILGSSGTISNHSHHHPQHSRSSLDSLGSGKTTLLNTMAGRMSSALHPLFGTTTHMNGRVLMNGKQVTSAEVRFYNSASMMNQLLYLQIGEENCWLCDAE
jgi:ABC-type multidrug transport system ATPase subunit